MKDKNKRHKILSEINKNLDKKFNDISKILNIKKKYNTKIDKNSDEIIVFENDKKIISAKFDFYGIIKPNGQFYWAYMIPGIDRRFIPTIEKIKDSAYLFENSDNKDMMLYRQILTQDSIILNDDEIKNLLQLILYLGDNIYFIQSLNSMGNIQLIFLKEIVEKFI